MHDGRARANAKRPIPELREAEPLRVGKRKAASQVAGLPSAGGSSTPNKDGGKQPYDSRVGPDGRPLEMLYEQDGILFEHDPREEANKEAAEEKQAAFNAAMEGA